MTSKKTLAGGCHCGRVRFSVDAPRGLEVTERNGSICRMTGFLHRVLARGKFRLRRADDLAVKPFDGRNREQNISKLSPISD